MYSPARGSGHALWLAHGGHFGGNVIVARHHDSRVTKAEGLLEHSAEAFAYLRANGVTKVVVEQKHTGSRAILVVCKALRCS